MNHRVVVFLPLRLLLVLAVSLAGRAAGAESSSPRPTEYALLRKISPARLRALMANPPDAQGFVGNNHQAGAWLGAGTQRGACRAVICGVVTDDLAAADDAWRGIEVTFARQQADGSFELNERPDGVTPNATMAVQSSFFFLQELGRAILVIRESPHEAHFHDRIVTLEPKIRRATAFIAAGYDTIIENSTKAVNRIVIAAKAFGLCGLVLHDDEFIAISRRLIAYALTLRDEGGVFIEKGGRDSSYNVVSILFGQVLSLHLPLPEFEAALPAAIAWELTRIGANGEVDVTGNTRTGVGTEASPFGVPKGVNYGEVVQALTLYGLLHHDSACLDAADRVFAFQKSGKAKPNR